METHYHFETEWILALPLKTVWPEFIKFQNWSLWWNGLDRLVSLSEKEDKRLTLGFVWKLWLIYVLKFVLTVDSIVAFSKISGTATGDLAGKGVFTFKEEDGKTKIYYTWDVVTTKPWMNVLSPIARPIFIYNHNLLMKRGGEGFAKYLHTTLLSHHETHT